MANYFRRIHAGSRLLTAFVNQQFFTAAALQRDNRQLCTATPHTNHHIFPNIQLGLETPQTKTPTMMACSSPEQEPDPPPEQAARPQSEQEFSRPLTAVNRSLCFGHSPTADEIYGTTEGDNARRLLQAREDEDLQIHHREPRHVALPHHDLYDVLPPPTRDLFTSAHYLLNSNVTKAHGAFTTRVGVAIAVATTTRYLPMRDNKNITRSAKHNNRAIFRLDYVENFNDSDMIRFVSSVIGNICARCEYFGFDVRGSRVLYKANMI